MEYLKISMVPSRQDSFFPNPEMDFKSTDLRITKLMKSSHFETWILSIKEHLFVLISPILY